MSEELGKIEKPLAEKYKKGRKIFFVPLVYTGAVASDDFLEKYNRFWEQVREQLNDLVSKLGNVARVYHELVPVAGEDGIKIIRELSEESGQIIESCLGKDVCVEALEDSTLLTEFMDWNRCLMIGLQNEQVFGKVSNFLIESSQKRNEYIAGKIDETLKEDEVGLVFMRENHQIQFPADIQVFYISPPALDEIKRWLRDRERQMESGPDKTEGTAEERTKDEENSS